METDLKISKEIDPHFFLNSFTTLGYLIHTDAEKAYLFNSTMAQVYQYFLLNKRKTLVAVGEEMGFIENYCYLLKVRHEDKLHVDIKILWQGATRLLVVPFVLQMLIDHAIRTNKFSEDDPLLLEVTVKARSIDFVQNRRTASKDPAFVHFTEMIDGHYLLHTGKGILQNSGAADHAFVLPLVNSA
jgi:LytS/YehU family sensor histidine kinase